MGWGYVDSLVGDSVFDGGAANNAKYCAWWAHRRSLRSELYNIYIIIYI